MAETNHQDIRLVCFDLGGVVLRICRSWREACERAGVDIRVDNPDEWILNDADHSVIAFQTGRIDHGTFSRNVSDAFGGAYSPREVATIHAAWVLDEYEGVADLIDEIHDAALATACLSNTNVIHWSAIQSHPAVRRLGTHLTSHELGLHKPDPAIYLEAQRRFRRAPGEIIFFDDLHPNVAAARDAGWHAEHIDHAADTAAQVRRALQTRGLFQPPSPLENRRK